MSSFVYDAEVSSGPLGSDLPLDPISCAGQMRLKKVHECAKRLGLSFAEDAINLITDYDCFSSILIDVLPPRVLTSKKWSRHIADLQMWRLVSQISASEARGYAKYFAVPKDKDCARAIFNGRELSKSFLAPPPVNLPRLNDVFEGLADKQFFVEADFRHFFHQLRMARMIQLSMCLGLGRKTYSWCTLPMGWSYSPHIAQSTSWVIICRALEKAKLLDKFDIAGLCACPRFLKAEGIFSTVYYDNLIAGFANVVDRDAFYQALLSVCREWRVAFSGTGPRRYNAKNMGCNANPDQHLTYLGIEFAYGKRPRDGEAELCWRHDLEKIERWKLARLKPDGPISPRAIAQLLGCTIWDAMVRVSPLCELSEELEVFKSVSRAAALSGWDTPVFWPPAVVSLMNDRLDLITINRWVTKYPDMCDIWAASDASDLGLGGVCWTGQTLDQTFTICEGIPSRLEGSHIYIREMYAALLTISKILKHRRNVSITLAVDNTAVMHALRNMYSRNKAGNEMICRIHSLLLSTGSTLTPVPIVSKDNPADEPSRMKATSEEVAAIAFQRIKDFYRGRADAVMNPARRPAFNGTLRHDEPEDAKWSSSFVDALQREDVGVQSDATALVEIVDSDPDVSIEEVSSDEDW